MSMRLVRRQKELCHQPQARERQKFKVAKLILRSRLILRDTHRLDVCGTRLGSTDQALIMSLSSAGGMKIKIKKKIKITHACRQRQIVGLVLILDPHLRQST
jgi:hypothetical protein